MCGIFGILNLDKSPVSLPILDRLTDTLKHRGPNGRGTYLSNYIGLGHRRLSILDTSELGAQPMKTENNSTITLNNNLGGDA